MVYHLAGFLQSQCHLLNVVHYVSFRALAAFVTTLSLSFALGGYFIDLARQHFRSQCRPYTPERHRMKGNLPTMGGVLMVGMVVFNSLVWCNLTDVHVWLMIAVVVGFACIGFCDDWYKIKYKRGISAGFKASCQFIVASIVSVVWWLWGAQTTITFPFFKELQPNIGPFFIMWAIFIILATSNAVNLTDGLDGLAIGSLLPNFLLFSVLCYLAGNYALAQYLHIPFVGTSEIAIIGSSLVASCLGFLWYNIHPAEIIMGDVGSLSLGAALGLMALMCKQSLLLSVSGGVFVAETLSVILQVGSYRFRGKKMFRMAPMHHHFELLGWPETRITVRFAIISLLLSILALITIKMR